MSEKNESKSVPTFLTLLVLLLIVVVGIQTWYMVEMKQTLSTMQNDQALTQAEEQLALETVTLTDTKNTVQAAENETAPAQSEPLIQQTPAGEKNQTADTHVADTPAANEPATNDPTTNEQATNDPVTNQSTSPVPPSAPPDLADNTPPNAPPAMQVWNPDQEILRMQRQMDRIFQNRYNRPPDNRQDFNYHFEQSISVPEIDMRQDQHRYIVLLNVPGAEQKDISVNLEGQRLTITGNQEYKKQNTDASGQFMFSEHRSGRFQRSITLREPVDKKGMQMRIDNGVLQIMIPKRQ